MADLLSVDDLPDGFNYPPSYIRVVDLGIVALEPWWMLQGDSLRTRYTGLRQRFPSRDTVPFARRQDNDDVACFDIGSGSIAVIHDFASAGTEQRAEYSDFYSWFRQAVQDMIEFDKG